MSVLPLEGETLDFSDKGDCGLCKQLFYRSFYMNGRLTRGLFKRQSKKIAVYRI